MTQDERWQKRYDEVVDFIDANKRNPSKHRVEEHDMLNWLKANRKVLRFFIGMACCRHRAGPADEA